MNEGPVTNLFDITVTRNDMYRSWVFPELFPHERPAMVNNWHEEDLVAYCGGVYAEHENYRPRWVPNVG